MQCDPLDAPTFFERGLGMLVQQLSVERAFMALVTHQGYKATWWALAKGLAPGPLIQEPEQGFCPWIVDHPLRPLVIRDAKTESRWKKHPAHERFGVRAYIGAPLWNGRSMAGVLSVQNSEPREFNHSDIALVIAVANLFSRTLEVEMLRDELRQTRDVLDLTAAVLQDSALESPDTGLPNRHYLDIWMRANLYLARRRGEIMAVVRFHLDIAGQALQALRRVADNLRGEDLLVDMSQGQFLLLLPRTAESGTEILLSRIREQIGNIPMGATIWNSVWNPDQGDLEISHARRRAEAALAESQSLPDSPVSWDIPQATEMTATLPFPSGESSIAE